jgi:hypothetical protein
MSRSRRVLAASVAALSVVTATSSAFAEGGRRYGGWDHGARHHRVEPAPHHRGYGHHGHSTYKKRDNTGKAIALGMAAIFLGAILSQAGRDGHRTHYDD